MELLFSLEQINVTLAFWRQASYAGGGVVVFFVVWILAVRLKRTITAAQRRIMARQWQSIIDGHTHDFTIAQRAVRRRPILALHLWNERYDECRADAIEASLNDLAKWLSLHLSARALLHSRQVHRILLAVRTLGRLKDRSAWKELEPFITHPNPFVALHAVEALLTIHAADAIPLLLPVIGRQTGWSPLAVATVLRSAGRDLASETLATAATTGNLVVGARLIRHLPITQSPAGLPILRRFLMEHDNASPEMLAACLFAFGEFQDPANLPIIRHHLSHPVWYVRVQAAIALGRVGTPNDEARLVALLTDPEWWVRYRAGEALITLRSMTEEKLENLQETLLAPEAQEILATCLARFRERRVSPSLSRPPTRRQTSPSS